MAVLLTVTDGNPRHVYSINFNGRAKSEIGVISRGTSPT